MGELLTVIIFLVILSVLVLVHEFGHYITAKLNHVKVEEFALGFPPRLASFKRGETSYSINAIPLGGYTKMSGEEDPAAERSLASKKPGPRLLILAAGSIMNLLLPVVLFSVAFMIPHTSVSEPILIQKVAPDSPAAIAGIQPGDQIISLNGKTMQNTAELSSNVFERLGQQITIGVKQPDGTVSQVSLVPRWKPPAGEGSIGVFFDTEAIMAQRVVSKTSEPLWQAVPDGISELANNLIVYKNGILSIFVGGVGVSALVGPVGIAQLTGEVAQAGISPLLQFAAVLSIALGITNLFPIPAMDGGRIVFVLIELLRRGKRISVRVESMVHLIGFGLLIMLMVVITYHDIFRIITGG